jgi:mannitol 2-dehydrogenase
MVPLSRTALDTLDPRVVVPAYDPTHVTTGIVHFGVGGFHRAHQAVHVDDLLAAGHLDWGICGVGVRAEDVAMRDALAAQDHLYTLQTVEPDDSLNTRVIGSIVDYLFAPEDPAAVLARIVDPSTRIVSLTVTEGGYSVDDATGEFAPHDADVLADLEDWASAVPGPHSALGFIVAALGARGAADATPFTVMSCDNIQGNGQVVRTAVLGFATRVDPDLAAWIEKEVAFPATMVDRITPATTDRVREEIATEYGIQDAWPVRAESFTQWVIEDHFTDGRPPFEDAGAQVVEDVEPYELMKLRLLNASHQALGHFGMLVAGPVLVHQVCREEIVAAFLWDYWRTEAIPTLQPVPGVDLDEYCATLLARFSSDAVADTVERLCTDASDRIAKFLLPVVANRLEAGAKVSASVLIIAAWSLALEGTSQTGVPTIMHDRRKNLLDAAVAAEKETPGAFLDIPEVFGELGQNERLREEFVAARQRVLDRGAQWVLENHGQAPLR